MTNLVRFTYQYRDKSNWKNLADLICINPNNHEVAEIKRAIKATLIDELWFIANQVGLPELFLFNNEPVADDDHCFHELLCVDEVVDSMESEEQVDDLISRFEEANKTGWKEFAPLRRNLKDSEFKSLGF